MTLQSSDYENFVSSHFKGREKVGEIEFFKAIMVTFGCSTYKIKKSAEIIDRLGLMRPNHDGTWTVLKA